MEVNSSVYFRTIQKLHFDAPVTLVLSWFSTFLLQKTYGMQGFHIYIQIKISSLISTTTFFSAKNLEMG
jgi:hypothetical protein